jgi:hypothetical protein
MHFVGKMPSFSMLKQVLHTEPLGFKGLNEQKKAEQGESWVVFAKVNLSGKTVIRSLFNVYLLI